jgi:hypothetical protein
MTDSKKAATKPEETKADKIWNKIKDAQLEIFALPNQTVSMHVKRVNIDPNEVHLILKSSAALPALEDVLRKVPLEQNEMFDVSQAAHYTVLKIIPKGPIPIG